MDESNKSGNEPEEWGIKSNNNLGENNFTYDGKLLDWNK